MRTLASARCIGLLGLIATLLASIALAQDPQPADTPAGPPVGAPEGASEVPAPLVGQPTATHTAFVRVPRVTQSPVIDGALREGAWEQAPVLGNFILLSGGKQALFDTEVRLVHDGTALYVGFRAKDTELASSPADRHERDDPAILTQDHVSVLLDGDREQRGYYYIALGRRGGIYDSLAALGPESADLEGLEARTSVVAGAWEAELRIPLADVGIDGADGETFSVNFCRYRSLTAEESSWSPARGSIHDPYNFGEVSLVTDPVRVEVFDLGDTYGELRGGANVKIRMLSGGPVSVAPSVTLIGGGYSRVFQVAPIDAEPQPTNAVPKAIQVDGGRPTKVEIPYYVLGTELSVAQVTVSDPTGRSILFRSPRVPLRDTWLRPRYQRLADTVNAIAEYANSLGANDSAKAQLQQEVGKERPKLQQIRDMIESRDTWGSVARWGQVRDLIIAASRSVDGLSTAASLVKGRTPAEATAGSVPKFVLSGSNWMEPATYKAVPRFVDVKPRAYCFAAPGETETVAVLVTSSVDLVGCATTLTDFVENTPTTPATGSFPGTQASVRVLHQWEQAGTGFAPAQPVTTPELLLKDDTAPITGPLPQVRLDGQATFNVGTWESRQLWVDVTVPVGTQEGLYESTLTVTPQNEAARSITILVKVLDLALAEPHQQWHVFFQNTLEGTGPLAAPMARYQAYLADIAAHGFDQATVADPGASLLAALEARWQAGLRAPATTYLHTVPVEELAGYVSTVQRLGEGKTLPELWYFTVANPRAPEDLETAIAAGQAIQQAGGKTITTIEPSMADLHGSTLDVPVYNLQQPEFENYVLSVLKGERPAATRSEFYHVMGSGEDPMINRLLCGLYLDKTGMDGVFVSSYQDPAGVENVFDELTATGRFRPQMLTYPSADGPIPTVQWVAAREGYDDMRYLATLQRAMETARSYATNAEVQTRLSEAQGVIDRIRRTIQVDWRFNMVGIPRGFYDEIRWEIAVKTLRLHEALRAAGATIGAGAAVSAPVAPVEPSPAPLPDAASAGPALDATLPGLDLAEISG